MLKRVMLGLALLAAATVTLPAQRFYPQLIGFDVVEANIVQMQTAMQRGQVTSKELVLQSLARVAIYKDLLNPVISLNREAIAEAEQRDIERARGVYRGPLHGIPIAVKDNINTTFMPTSPDNSRRGRFRQRHKSLRMVQSRCHTSFFPRRRLLIARRHDTTDCPLPRPLRQTPRRDVRSAPRELGWRRDLAQGRGSALRVDRWLRPVPG